MGAVAYEYHSVLRFPNFFSFSTKQPKLGNPIFTLKDVSSSSSSFGRKDLQLTVSCIGSEGNGGNQPPRRRSAPEQTPKKNGRTKKRGSGSRKSSASNQEEIISLFRRIQTSISKQESVNAEKINAEVSEDSPSSDSILQVLRGSRKQKAKASDKEGGKVLTRRNDGEEQQTPVTEFKLIRPLSTFVKRSPIPSLSIPRAERLELNNRVPPSAAAGSEGSEELGLVKVEDMKLHELKELAKSRGIKGYSKLKKSELVKLLESRKAM